MKNKIVDASILFGGILNVLIGALFLLTAQDDVGVAVGTVVLLIGVTVLLMLLVIRLEERWRNNHA